MKKRMTLKTANLLTYTIPGVGFTAIGVASFLGCSSLWMGTISLILIGVFFISLRAFNPKKAEQDDEQTRRIRTASWAGGFYGMLFCALLLVVIGTFAKLDVPLSAVGSLMMGVGMLACGLAFAFLMVHDGEGLEDEE